MLRQVSVAKSWRHICDAETRPPGTADDGHISGGRWSTGAVEIPEARARQHNPLTYEAAVGARPRIDRLEERAESLCRGRILCGWANATA